MRVQCSACSQWMEVDLEMLGEKIQCPHCQKVYFLVANNLASDDHVRQLKRELLQVRTELRKFQGASAESDGLRAKVVSLESELGQAQAADEKIVEVESERDLFKQTVSALERAQQVQFEQRKQKEAEREAALKRSREESQRLQQQLVDKEAELARTLQNAVDRNEAGFLKNRIAELEAESRGKRELMDDLMFTRNELKSAQREITAQNERIHNLEYAVADRSEVADQLVQAKADHDRIHAEHEKLKKRVAELDALVD